MSIEICAYISDCYRFPNHTSNINQGNAVNDIFLSINFMVYFTSLSLFLSLFNMNRNAFFLGKIFCYGIVENFVFPAAILKFKMR